MATRAAAAAAAAPAEPAVPPTAGRLPRFNGSGNFYAWLYAVENLTHAVVGPERSRLILAALDGPALDMAMLACPPQAFDATWDVVRPALLGVFFTEERGWERDLRFAQTLIWTGDMSAYIAVFAREVANSPAPVADPDRVRYFLAGLASQPAMVTMIARTNPGNTQTLLTAANTFKTFASAPAPTPVDVVRSDSGRRRFGKRRGAGHGNGAGTQSSGSGADKPPRFSGACWNCGRTGHRRAECTQPRDDHDDSDDRRGGRAGGRVDQLNVGSYPSVVSSSTAPNVITEPKLVALGRSATLDSVYQGTLVVGGKERPARFLIDSGAGKNIIAESAMLAWDVPTARGKSNTFFSFANGTKLTCLYAR